MALAAIGFVLARSGLPGRSGSESQSRAIEARSSGAPDPALSWQFAALRATTTHIFLTISNRHAFPVDIRVHVGHGIRRVRVPAEGQAELEVSPQEAAQALTLDPGASILEHFAVLPVVTGQVLLNVTNRNPFPVRVRLRTVQRVQTTRIPAESMTEMGLTGREAAEPVSITASGAVLPARLVTGAHGVQVSYATPASVPAASRRQVAMPTPPPPRPSQSWHFAPLSRVKGSVLLTISNTNAFPVTARIQVGQQVKRVRVPARSGIEMDINHRQATHALTVTASAPIVPARLVITRRGVQATYGSPGSSK